MTVQPPPTQQPIVEDDSGKIGFPWALFFDQIFVGDEGNEWSPAVFGLAFTGVQPQIVGRYYKLSRAITLFRVDFIPATGGTTSSTAGATVITNFPLEMAQNGVVIAVSGAAGGGIGSCDAENNVVWTPTWTGIGNKVTILGLVEAS